jgi:nucleotide-binding universal stress UspA family protein
MALIVPFDGSPLSRIELVRATQFRAVLDEELLVVSVIPRDNVEYARDKGWLDAAEPFDLDAIVARLRDAVSELAPDADFQHVLVDQYATVGTIAGRIKKFARIRGGTIVFLGSKDAGRIINAFTVGQAIAADRSYDTYIITNEDLPKIEKLDAERPLGDVLT